MSDRRYPSVPCAVVGQWYPVDTPTGPVWVRNNGDGSFSYVLTRPSEDEGRVLLISGECEA